MNYSPKRIGEKPIIWVPFDDLLPAGATIVSATWAMNVVKGADPNAQQLILGSAIILGSDVGTFIDKGKGVIDVVYWPVCTAVFSDGQEWMRPEPGHGRLLITP